MGVWEAAHPALRQLLLPVCRGCTVGVPRRVPLRGWCGAKGSARHQRTGRCLQGVGLLGFFWGLRAGGRSVGGSGCRGRGSLRQPAAAPGGDGRECGGHGAGGSADCIPPVGGSDGSSGGGGVGCPFPVILRPSPDGPRAAAVRRPSAGISLIMWNALYTAEKVIIRWTLLTEACYFTVQFLGEWEEEEEAEDAGAPHLRPPTGGGEEGEAEEGRTTGGTKCKIGAVALGLME